MCKNVDLFDVIVNKNIINNSSNNIGTQTGVSDENFPDDSSSNFSLQTRQMNIVW